MNLSEVFIRRPIATSLLILGFAGSASSPTTPAVSDMPNVDLPT